MSKIVIIILFLIVSSHVNAEWTYVGTNDEQKYYIDYDRITKGKGFSYYWLLQNNPRPTESGDFSYIMYVMLHCDPPRRQKVLKYISYQYRFGRGKMLDQWSDKEEPWSYPKPESVLENIMNEVCRH
mgnify:CR=1 FL=1